MCVGKTFKISWMRTCTTSISRKWLVPVPIEIRVTFCFSVSKAQFVWDSPAQSTQSFFDSHLPFRSWALYLIIWRTSTRFTSNLSYWSLLALAGVLRPAPLWARPVRLASHAREHRAAAGEPRQSARRLGCLCIGARSAVPQRQRRHRLLQCVRIVVVWPAERRNSASSALGFFRNWASNARCSSHCYRL